MNRFLLFFSLLVLCRPAVAVADAERLVLFGVRIGCAYDEELTKAVARHAPVAAQGPHVLSPRLARSACQGAGCAALLAQQCPGSKGRLLGGVVEPGPKFTKVRLWLHDLQSGQTAYLDDYCQGCAMSSLVPKRAAYLLEHADFGRTAPSAQPLYCTESAAQAAPSGGYQPKVFFHISGKGAQRSAVSTAVQEQLQGAGLQVTPVHPRDTSFPQAELERLTAADPGSQVLMVDVHAGGKLELYLYDQPSKRTEASTLDCPECSKEELARKLKTSVASLLATCFAQDCARVTPMRNPPEACTEFKDLRCGGETDLGLGGGKGDTKPTEPEISHRMAKLTQGALWGLVAVGAVTTAALFGVNASGAASVTTPEGFQVSQILKPAAWTAAGLTAVSLAITIPLTVATQRARPRPQQSAPSAGGPAGDTEALCPR